MGWQWLQLSPSGLAVLAGVLALVASAHVVLSRREVGAAAAWVGLIWLVPFLGIVLYWLLGINRIKRKAGRLKRSRPRKTTTLPLDELSALLGSEHTHLLPLARLTNHMARRPMTHGNAVTPLVSGDSAYPAMLAAIEDAGVSVSLCSYIFDNDRVGRQFAEALARAKRRGVEVRVLVDAVGARYSWPRSIFALLQKARIPSARFLPTRLPWRMSYANLRNHRKVLVVDGHKGFTGGMNILQGCQSREELGPEIDDLHFAFEGPVVSHLQESFAEDWGFATGESLDGERWFPEIFPVGKVLSRGICEGPDEDFDKLRWAYHGGLDCSRDRVFIVTPYFLPDPPLTFALGSAALRGVTVDIVLPAHNNLSLVQWASTAMLCQVLEYGCRVWLSPPPFDHSKLMVVDGCWSFVGSGNWDTRSLRLNFELNVECYGAGLGRRLDRIGRKKIESATRLTLDDLHGRSLPAKLRDGAARLLTPYL